MRDWLRTRRGQAITVGAVVFVLTVIRLLVPTAIGLGDQGDAHRLLCNLDVRADASWNESLASEVVVRWVPHEWVGPTCGANGTGERYHSSQVAILRVAKVITGPVGLGPGLDLRVAGVIAAALIAVLLACIVAFAPGGQVGRLLLVGALWLAVVDAGVAGYFVSGYSEPAAIIGLLGMVAAGLAMFRSRTSSVPSLVAMAVSGSFALTAKSQMISLLPLIVLALVWQPAAPLLAQRRRTPQPLLRGRAVGAGLAAVVVLVSGLYVTQQPPRFQVVNRHNQVFQTLLVLGDDPKADLRDLGLDPSLAPAAGQPILADPQLTGSPAYERFQAEVGGVELGRFYVTHPDRLLLLARRGLDAAASYRIAPYLGQYQRGTGNPPYRQESRVGVWAMVYEIFDAVPVLLLLAWAGLLFLTVRVVRRTARPAARATALVTVGTLLGAFGQFWTALLGDGLVELTKHLALANLLFLWSIPLAVLALVAARRPSPPPKLPPDLHQRLGPRPAREPEPEPDAEADADAEADVDQLVAAAR